MTTDALELTRTLPGPPSEVWTALTTADGLARWWWTHWRGVTYAADPRVGGGYRIEATEQSIAVRGDFVELDPPTRLVMTWVWVEDGAPGPVERVEIDLTPDDDGTVLRLRHTGPWSSAGDPAPAEAYRQGWEFVLAELERVLAEEAQRRA